MHAGSILLEIKSKSTCMYAKRLDNLPPYLFAQIDKLKAQKRSEGVDVIDFGVGDPDLPTPKHIVDSLCDAARDPATHHYPDYTGMIEYREAVSEWYKKRFGVSFDAKTEVLALIGSKEGIAHVPEAFVNPGDYVLATDPGYPVYKTSTLFSEGILHELPIKEENDFLPELDKIPKDVLKKAKLMFFGYPNNPTAAIAPLSFYEEVVEFAKENNINVIFALCSAMPYSGRKIK